MVSFITEKWLSYSIYVGLQALSCLFYQFQFLEDSLVFMLDCLGNLVGDL